MEEALDLSLDRILNDYVVFSKDRCVLVRNVLHVSMQLLCHTCRAAFHVWWSNASYCLGDGNNMCQLSVTVVRF